MIMYSMGKCAEYETGRTYPHALLTGNTL